LVGKCIGNRSLKRPKQRWKVIRVSLQEMSYENTNWFWMRFDDELWLRRFLRRLNDHQLFMKTLFTELIIKLRSLLC
jgi:hypothetical protein